MAPVTLSISEAKLQRFHRDRKRVGAAVGVFGAALFIIGGVASELLFWPLGVFSFAGFFGLFVGPILAWQSHVQLRVRGDLEVEIAAEGFRHRFGAAPWSERRPLHMALAEPKRLDLIAAGAPTSTLLLPMDDDDKARTVSELRALGVSVMTPDRSARRLAAIIVAAVLGVSAFLMLWRLLILAMFGLVMLGIQTVAPADPAVQAGLFFALAFGVGLPMLAYRVYARMRE